MNVIKADYTPKHHDDSALYQLQDLEDLPPLFDSVENHDDQILSTSSNKVISEQKSLSSKPSSRKSWSNNMKDPLHTKRKRRSSLTSNEKRFLSAIENNNGGSNNDENKCRGSNVKRDSLRSTISSVKNNLTSSEFFFLENIANCDEIDDEMLDNAQMVLTTDPLYNKEKDEEESSSKDKRPSTSSSHKNPPRRSSFRQELWEIKPSSSFVSEDDEEKQEEEKTNFDEKFEVSFVGMLGNLSNAIQENTGSIFQCSISSSFSSWDEDDIEPRKTRPTIEISPTKEEEEEGEMEFVVLGTSVEDCTCRPHVMSPPIMNTLRSHLPFVIQEDNFWLKYSMMRDGGSMHTLHDKIRNSARTIIAIETLDGDVFGSFTSSCWHPRGLEYYGSGEAFLWRLRKVRTTPCDTLEEQVRLESDIEVFPWNGANRNIQSLVNLDSRLVIGGGNSEIDPFGEESFTTSSQCGSGLSIASTLLRGTSDPCCTFNSPRLPTNGEDVFEVANIEVWTFSPVDTIEQAEILESSRRIIFDQGNFSEQ